MCRLVCVVRSPRLRDCLAFQQFKPAVRGYSGTVLKHGLKESCSRVYWRLTGGLSARLRNLTARSIATCARSRYQDLAKGRSSARRRRVSEGLSPKSFL
jgi:hypothetical protein